jgi:hypothetical protein
VKRALFGLAAALITVSAAPAYSQVRITEVAPWSSGNSPVAADWFELTNFGSSAVNISGWKVDDNSNSFIASLALNGVTSIAAGASVIFMESTGGAGIPNFIANWFGANPAPAVGYYSGSGIGLGTGGDAVNIYDVAGVLQANVTFGASPTGPTFATFNNAAGLNNTAISLLSAVGADGAFVAAGNAVEIGSPGLITAAVPEPETYALMLAGLGLIGAFARKRRQSSNGNA